MREEMQELGAKEEEDGDAKEENETRGEGQIVGLSITNNDKIKC